LILNPFWCLVREMESTKLEKLISEFEAFIYKSIVNKDFESCEDKYLLFLSNFFVLDNERISQVKSEFMIEFINLSNDMKHLIKIF